MSYYVKAALVVATASDGTQRYVYAGATMPEDIPAGEVSRLFKDGFLGETEIEDPDAEGAKPRDKWTIDQLTAYADQHSIDLGDAKLKAEILAAIDKAEQV